MVYPTDYGFIPDTLSLDGDPLDVMICVSEPTFPGCVAFAKPIALLEMEDEHGVDPHVLGVPVADPGWNWIERLSELPPPLAAEIEHFFEIYKDLDSGRRSTVQGWRDRDAALLEIDESRQRHLAAATDRSKSHVP